MCQPNREPLTYWNGRCPLEHLYQRGAKASLLVVPGLADPEQPEEVLVPDARAGLTPGDMVELKLLHLLRGANVAGGQSQMEALRVRATHSVAAHPLN
jgi:hypothetical protein